jgi:U3 small nucleolar RNA-associated protein 4
VSQFSFLKPSESTNSTAILLPTSRWVHSCSRRLHSHDVRALASWPPHTPLSGMHRHRFAADIAPIVVSAGLDMSVVLTPAALAAQTVLSKVVNPLATSVTATFEESYQRRMGWTSGPSGVGVVRVARRARLVMVIGERDVGVWRIRARRTGDAAAMMDDANVNSWGWEKLLEMELKVRTNLIASAISDDGRWMVVSDLYETKLFALVTKVSVLPPLDEPTALMVVCNSKMSWYQNASASLLRFCKQNCQPHQTGPGDPPLSSPQTAASSPLRPA